MAMVPRAIFRCGRRPRCGMRRDRASPDRCTGCLTRRPSPATPSSSATGRARPNGRVLCSPSCCIWCCSRCWSAPSIGRLPHCWSWAGSRPIAAVGAVAVGTAWRIFPFPRRAPALQPPRHRRQSFRRRSLPHQHHPRSSFLRHPPWRRIPQLPGRSTVQPTPRLALDLGPGAGLVVLRVGAVVPGRGRGLARVPVEEREDWRGVLVRARRCGPPSTSSPGSFAVDHCT